MRSVPLLLVVLVSGCAADVADADPVIYDQALDIPAGDNGFVELILNDGQHAGWTWSSDSPVVALWELACAGGTQRGGSGEAAKSGQDDVQAAENGCKLTLFWHHATAPTHVEARITGTAGVVRDGTERGV